jgi:hypothetical protein
MRSAAVRTRHAASEGEAKAATAGERIATRLFAGKAIMPSGKQLRRI